MNKKLIYFMPRMDGAGSEFMLAADHQAWDDAAEDTVQPDTLPQHFRPETYVDDEDGTHFDYSLEYWYEHGEALVYSMMGWCALGCHHLAEEAWQAPTKKNGPSYEGMRVHETQPSYSQLYSQEDSQQCGKPLLFVCTCAFSSTPAGLTSLTSLREHCRWRSSVFAV
jgi:hypothetical protein